MRILNLVYYTCGRGLSFNEGGRGLIIVAYPGEYYYLCLWLTPKLNWRVHWHHKWGWGWSVADS